MVGSMGFTIRTSSSSPTALMPRLPSFADAPRPSRWPRSIDSRADSSFSPAWIPHHHAPRSRGMPFPTPARHERAASVRTSQISGGNFPHNSTDGEGNLAWCSMRHRSRIWDGHSLGQCRRADRGRRIYSSPRCLGCRSRGRLPRSSSWPPRRPPRWPPRKAPHRNLRACFGRASRAQGLAAAFSMLVPRRGCPCRGGTRRWLAASSALILVLVHRPSPLPSTSFASYAMGARKAEVCAHRELPGFRSGSATGGPLQRTTRWPLFNVFFVTRRRARRARRARRSRGLRSVLLLLGFVCEQLVHPKSVGQKKYGALCTLCVSTS